MYRHCQMEAGGRNYPLLKDKANCSILIYSQYIAPATFLSTGKYRVCTHTHNSSLTVAGQNKVYYIFFCFTDKKAGCQIHTWQTGSPTPEFILYYLLGKKRATDLKYWHLHSPIKRRTVICKIRTQVKQDILSKPLRLPDGPKRSQAILSLLIFFICLQSLFSFVVYTIVSVGNRKGCLQCELVFYLGTPPTYN